jgi:hypothetical protein
MPAEAPMVLTKSELIQSLQNEVRILLHLASKVDDRSRDYRPTPKQRSTTELLQYLTIMGPGLIEATKNGTFDPAVWTEHQKAAAARNYDQTIAALQAQPEQYASLINGMSDDELRSEVDMFGGGKTSRGAFITNLVLSGCAAYRTQLFLYLKSCGRDELSTYNLWGGRDAPAS